MAGTRAAGLITAINASGLTLTTRGGEPLTVRTTTSTTVNGATGGDLKGLAVGQFVLVLGSKASDGSYQATAIMVRPDKQPGGARWGQSSDLPTGAEADAMVLN